MRLIASCCICSFRSAQASIGGRIRLQLNGKLAKHAGLNATSLQLPHYFRTVAGEYSTASHQLRHAPSRQRLKLKRRAPVIRLTRDALTRRAFLVMVACTSIQPLEMSTSR